MLWYNSCKMKDLKTLFIIGFVFVVFVFLMFAFSGRFNTKRAIELYSQGLEFYQKRDYQNAYYNFSKISRFSRIYHIALLRQAICAKELNDHKTAYYKFKLLSVFCKDENIKPFALYNLGISAMELKKYKKAEQAFSLLSKKYPKSDFKKAASYMLGLIYFEKNPHLAKNFFIEYLKYAPMGRYSQSCAQALEDLNLVLNSEEKYYIANYFYEIKRYEKAIFYLKTSSDCRSYLLLAKILEFNKNYKQASDLYYKTLEFSDEKIKPEDIAYAVDKYAALSPSEKKEASALLGRSIKNPFSRSAILFEYAKYLPKLSAIKCYQTIYTKYPSSYQAAEAMWMVFWYNMENDYFSRAKQIAQVYLNTYENKKSTPAMKFWYAKILLYEGRKLQAKNEFKNLIKTEPQSYYSYIAYNIINDRYTPLNTANLGELPSEYKYSEKDYKDLFDNNQNLIMIMKLSDLGLIKTLNLHNDFIDSFIAHKEGNTTHATYLANKALNELEKKPPADDIRYKLAYPLVYVDLVNSFSKKYSQNPYLMLALIREESTFNKNAKSSVGASGLMQLMPQTASSLGLGEFNYYDLFNPQLNINLGIKYFSTLKNMFNSNEMLAVLSYNGGPSNVNLWRSNSSGSTFDAFVENIPYGETQNYIKRVFGSYWNYARLYAN